MLDYKGICHFKALMEVKCPRCKKLYTYENNEFRPFCSKRCKLIDLGDWASEKFKIPTEDFSSEDADDEDEEGVN